MFCRIRFPFNAASRRFFLCSETADKNNNNYYYATFSFYPKEMQFIALLLRRISRHPPHHLITNQQDISTWAKIEHHNQTSITNKSTNRTIIRRHSMKPAMKSNLMQHNTITLIF